MGWTIKQTTEKTGISADTLRYYDKEGIVSPKRNESGYRQYDDNDISILKNIIVMKYAHFSLAEIKSMEELFTHNPSTNCSDICKEILNSKITELNQVVYNYQKIVTLMEALLQMIDGSESHQSSNEQIDKFINQIFDHIQKDNLSLNALPSVSNRNEVK